MKLYVAKSCRKKVTICPEVIKAIPFKIGNLKIFDRLSYFNCLIKLFPRGGSGKSLMKLMDEAIEILVVLALIGLKNPTFVILKTRIFVINYLGPYCCS